MEPKKKVLVVEDEPALSAILRGKLEHGVCEVLEAKDGEEGLIIALSEHPDIILLDLNMPGMDGMTMLHKLRADAWGAKAGVIILTNVGDTEKVAQAMESDAFEYYIKSDTQIDTVVARVKERLGMR